MILVFMRDGNCVEVEAAVGCDRRDDLFICFDEEGRECASFLVFDVEAYTMNEEMVTVLQDEVCDEKTLIPADPEPEQTEPPLPHRR